MTSQKLGKVVSTLTSTSGLMHGGGFGFATEADANSYTIDTQYYLCTEIHLAAADPAFGATGVGGIGAKMGATGTGSGIGTIKNLHTPDGGLTWLADLITLPAMNPQGTQTPVPAYSCGTSGTGGTGGSSRQRRQRRQGGSTGSGGSAGKGGSTGTVAARAEAAPRAAAAAPEAVAAPAASEGRQLWQRRQWRQHRRTAAAAGAAAPAERPARGRWKWRHDGHGGLNGTGGANEGSGGSAMPGTGGTSTGGDTGGATGTGATGGLTETTDGASGCSCVVGARSPHGGMFAFLLLGALALRARRRRNRA